MAVIRTPLPHASYTTLRNCWLRDPRISLKAKGLLGYLSSHSEHYRCSQAQMIAESDDGRAAVRTALAELEDAGYLTRIPMRSAGRYAEDDYTLADPFDAAGHLLGAETAPSGASLGAEINQRRFSDAEKQPREITPLEDQEKKTKEQTPLPPADAGRPQEQTLPLPDTLPQPQQRRSRARPTGDALFDEFWDAYPKKEGKDDARRRWKEAIRRADPDKIIAVVRVYPFDLTRMKYVKQPATWLHKGCWEDDLEAVAADHRKPDQSHAYTPGNEHWAL